MCQVVAGDDFAALFFSGDLDHYFLEIVRTRADRIWRSVRPAFSGGDGEYGDGNEESKIRWELELIGESCPMVDQGFLVCLMLILISCPDTCISIDSSQILNDIVGKLIRSMANSYILTDNLLLIHMSR